MLSLTLKERTLIYLNGISLKMHQLRFYDYESKLNHVIVIHEHKRQFIKESRTDQFLI